VCHNFKELGPQTLEIVKPYGPGEQKQRNEKETIFRDEMDFPCPITHDSLPVISPPPPCNILTCLQIPPASGIETTWRSVMIASRQRRER
jgi:hypothetical protein